MGYQNLRFMPYLMDCSIFLISAIRVLLVSFFDNHAQGNFVYGTSFKIMRKLWGNSNSSAAFAAPAFEPVCDAPFHSQEINFSKHMGNAKPDASGNFPMIVAARAESPSSLYFQKCRYVPNQEMIDLLNGGASASSADRELIDLLKQQIASQQELIELLKAQQPARK